MRTGTPGSLKSLADEGLMRSATATREMTSERGNVPERARQFHPPSGLHFRQGINQLTTRGYRPCDFVGELY